MLVRQTRVVDLPGQLGTAITKLCRQRQRVLVGIDGPDGAGKTTLADRLAEVLETPTLRASVDRFHLPREQRYQRGELSPDGYYYDSFDYPQLVSACLSPFLDGASRVTTGSYDHRANAEVNDAMAVPSRAVLIVDGVFLLRPELRRLWTLSVYLRVSPDETLRRAQERDLELFGSAEEIKRRYLERYLPGQALYRREADPEARANLLVDNERFELPRIERWTVSTQRTGTEWRRKP